VQAALVALIGWEVFVRKVIGIVMLALSTMASVFLLATGKLGSEHVVDTASGGTSAGAWHVTVVAFDPNWWVAVPLGVCFLAGLLCVVFPERRQFRA